MVVGWVPCLLRGREVIRLRRQREGVELCLQKSLIPTPIFLPPVPSSIPPKPLLFSPPPAPYSLLSTYSLILTSCSFLPNTLHSPFLSLFFLFSPSLHLFSHPYLASPSSPPLFYLPLLLSSSSSISSPCLPSFSLSPYLDIFNLGHFSPSLIYLLLF